MGRLIRVIFDPWAWFGIFLGLLFVAMVAFAPNGQANTTGVTIENTSWECMHYKHKDMTLYHITAFNNNDWREPVTYSWEGTRPGSERLTLGKHRGSYLNIWVRPGEYIENIRVEVDGELIFFRVKPFKYKAKCA